MKNRSFDYEAIEKMNIEKGEYRLEWHVTDYEISYEDVPKQDNGEIYPGGVFKQKDGSTRDESYYPLETVSPILLKLGRVDENDEHHILKFVSKYGTLGTRFLYHEKERHVEDLVFDFKREVRLAKKFLGIYEAFKREDKKKMRKLLQLEIDDVKRLLLDRGDKGEGRELLVPAFLFTRRRPREDFRLLRTRFLTVDEEKQVMFYFKPEDDILQVGLLYLRKVLNAYLADTAPLLCQENGEFEGHYFCDTLLSAIYLQMYLLVKENKSLGMCAGCQKPFVPKRLNNIYCKEKCRQKAKQRRYRDREKHRT